MQIDIRCKMITCALAIAMLAAAIHERGERTIRERRAATVPTLCCSST